MTRRRLLRHPRIHTGTAAGSVTGVLLEGERIVAVGAAERLAEQASEVQDLQGAAVLPGLIDAHLHGANLAHDSDALDLRGTGSMRECLALIADHVATAPGDGWLVDSRWDGNRWDPPGRPDRHSLDRACPDRPAILPSIDGHSAWVNSAALARAGIGSATPDPPGGVIVRDAAGEPTGILQETAIDLVRDVARRQSGDSAAALQSALERAQQRLLSVGLTSICDFDGEDARAAYLALKRDGKLALRVHKSIPVDALEQAIDERRRTGAGDDWFTTGPLKLFSDGALGSRTCLMTEEFAGDPGNRGVAVTGADELAELSRRAVAAGIGVAVHAIGDRANAVVIDAFAAARPITAPNLILRIEHAQYLRPADVARIAALGVVASMQPIHCTTDYRLCDELLGEHDILAYGWRTLADAGVALAFGSDAPVEDPNPFLGLHAAVTRQRTDGSPADGWRAQEALSIGAALAAHTLGAAAACGLHRRVGSLAPGKLADLIVLDRDPLAVPADELHATQVLTTIVGGQVRWRRED